jgi:hypothetical protein
MLDLAKFAIRALPVKIQSGLTNMLEHARISFFRHCRSACRGDLNRRMEDIGTLVEARAEEHWGKPNENG